MKVISFFLLNVLLLYAQEWGAFSPSSGGFSYLGLGEAKWAGISENNTAVPGDALSIFYNPATVYALDVPQIATSIRGYSSSLQVNHLSFIVPYSSFSFGFNMQSFIAEGFEKRDSQNPDSILSVFNFYNINPGVCFLYRIQGISLGFSQSIGLSIYEENYKIGVLSRLGIIYNRARFHTGVSYYLINFTPLLYPLKFGASYNYKRILLSMDISPFVYSGGVGFEYSFNSWVNFRSGVVLEKDVLIRKFSMGMGIFARGAEINYSFVYDFISGFNNAISISYNLRIGEREREQIALLARKKTIKEIKEEELRLSNSYYKQAVALAQEKKFLKALRLINFAILLQPENEKYIETKRTIEQKEKAYTIESLLRDAKGLMDNKKYLEALVYLKKAFVLDSSKGIDSLIEFVQKKHLLSIQGLPEDSIIQKQYETGLNFYLNKAYKKAIAVWDSILTKLPGNIFIMNQIDIAEKILKKEQLRAKKEIESLIKKGLLKSAERKLNGYSNILEQKDIRVYRARIRNYSSNIIQRELEKALNNIKAGKYLAAKVNFSRVLALDPGNRTAKEQLKKIKELTKKDIENLNLKAIVAYTDGNLTLAIQLWKEILRLDPGNKSAKRNIRRAEDRLKRGH